MIADDLHAAIEDGRIEQAAQLFLAMRHFLSEFP
jgi:hypothetical protein